MSRRALLLVVAGGLALGCGASSPPLAVEAPRGVAAGSAPVALGWTFVPSDTSPLPKKAGAATLDGGMLVTPDGKRVAPPTGKRWQSVAGDVALACPPDGEPLVDVALHDARTGRPMGKVTSRDTAAGGSELACVGLVADGHAVMLRNSRGTYVKDARTDRTLPCGMGAYADDLSSCITLDASPFVYGGSAPKDEAVDFAIDLYDLGKPRSAAHLAVVPRGLNRSPESPRTWDAAYCSPHEAVVLHDGKLTAYETPSGKVLAEIALTVSADGVLCAKGEARVQRGQTIVGAYRLSK